MALQDFYNQHEQQLMLQSARDSIKNGMETAKPLQIDASSYPDKLRQKRASFVTLHKPSGNNSKQLRGCIGTISADTPLIESIAQNAFAAAFKDARFAPLDGDELDKITISISILTPARRMKFNNEHELLEIIQPGVDGLILEDGYNRGLFLPSVWEQLPDAKSFLGQLKRKAGLPMDYWSDHLRVSVFHTVSFSE